MRLGILNIYWFGLQKADDGFDAGFYHTEADDSRVAELVRFGDSDIIVFVEIVSVTRLERMLATQNGRWRVRDATAQVVASAAPSSAGDQLQRVVFAWNEEHAELLRWNTSIAAGPRRPVVARFRSRTDNSELTLVGIHPKSGNPIGWDADGALEKDRLAGLKRAELFQRVSSWLSAPPEGFSGPTVVMGDFNALRGSPECSALRSLAGWQWPEPSFVPPHAQRRTTKTDPAVIDHFVLSPDLSAERHEVLAFDELPQFTEGEPFAPEVWKRTTDHRFVRITLRMP